MRRRGAVLVVLTIAGAGGLSCGSSPSKDCSSNPAGYAPAISTTDFPASPKIDNKLLPLVPGTTFRFQTTEGNLVETAVTSDRRTVLGVACVVVHDFERSPTGELLEDTYDWFAQDNAGNVWYFGEDTKAYQAGNVVSTRGTWEAGVDCALPGIVMEASPAVGDSYRQEYLAGAAEDKADVLGLAEMVTVPYGKLTGCLKTRDYTDLEPGKFEHKYYCPGVGLVATVDLVTVGSGGREELVSINGNSSDGGSPTDAGAHD